MTVKRSIKDYALLISKGIAMGAADVVPGVSGGTVAFITGIYDEFLGSLKNLGPQALKVWFDKGFVEFWHYINGWFLLSVFGGILISLKTFAALITSALEAYPLLVWGFFSGLIVASVWLLFDFTRKRQFKEWLFLLIGTAFVVAVSVATPAQLPGSWWILFLGGFVAISAMILPGISGSFILLLVGLYPIFLSAINDLDIAALASFGAGCVAGLLVFARFLHWLLSRFYHNTIMVLIGFLIGSLNVTWPWKETIETMVNRHGELVPLVQHNVLPSTYTLVNQQNNLLIGVIIAFITGMILVVGTEKMAKILK